MAIINKKEVQIEYQLNLTKKELCVIWALLGHFSGYGENNEFKQILFKLIKDLKPLKDPTNHMADLIEENVALEDNKLFNKLVNQINW